MPTMPHYSPRLAPPALDTGLRTAPRLRRSVGATLLIWLLLILLLLIYVLPIWLLLIWLLLIWALLIWLLLIL